MMVVSPSTSMSVATGGEWGRVPPGLKLWGRCPPEIAFLNKYFLDICQNFQIFQYFQIKVAEIRREIGIWESSEFGSLNHLNRSPQSESVPQSKLRGDAPVYIHLCTVYPLEMQANLSVGHFAASWLKTLLEMTSFFVFQRRFASRFAEHFYSNYDEIKEVR